MKHVVALFLLLLTPVIRANAQESEISLFNSDGTPVAYVAMDDEMFPLARYPETTCCGL